MAKLILNDITSVSGGTTVINNNNAAIETAFENTLSRDGTSPNAMNADLDMDSNRIINVADPVSAGDAVNLGYMQDYVELNGGGGGSVTSLPNGGTAGQALIKNSGVDGDATWTSTIQAPWIFRPPSDGVSTWGLTKFDNPSYPPTNNWFGSGYYTDSVMIGVDSSGTCVVDLESNSQMGAGIFATVYAAKAADETAHLDINQGPLISLARMNGTGAVPSANVVNTGLGSITFGVYSASEGVMRTLAGIGAIHTDVSGSYGGAADLIFYSKTAASSNPLPRFKLSGAGGFYANSATGGDKGAGTINATGLYINGVAVSGATPGGANTQVQYNNGGVFAGDAGFTYDATNKALSVGGGTVTTSKPVLALTQTWNAGAVTFDGITLDVTNTASATASRLLDLRVDGTSRFKVDKNGWLSFGSAGVNTIQNDTNSVVTIAANVRSFLTRSDFSIIPDAAVFGWGNLTSFGRTLELARDANDVLAQRRSTNAQTFRIYNTYTDASNYERGYASWVSNEFRIGTEKAGTGTSRSLVLYYAGTQKIVVGTSITMSATTSFNNNTITGYRPTFTAVTTDGTEGNAGRTVTNRGATATVTRTLQNYTDNIKFIRVASQALRIVPTTGKSFRRADGTLTTADKYLELASDGAMVELQFDGTEWLCVYERGTINVQP